jgi:hypothetical protein
MCPLGLPVAIAPEWQVAQVPGWTPWWLNRAPLNVDVLWHASQGCGVGTCRTGITFAARTLAPVV